MTLDPASLNKLFLNIFFLLSAIALVSIVLNPQPSSQKTMDNQEKIQTTPEPQKNPEFEEPDKKEIFKENTYSSNLVEILYCSS